MRHEPDIELTAASSPTKLYTVIELEEDEETEETVGDINGVLTEQNVIKTGKHDNRMEKLEDEKKAYANSLGRKGMFRVVYKVLCSHVAFSCDCMNSIPIDCIRCESNQCSVD